MHIPMFYLFLIEMFFIFREASWETEPNAYRELLERDITCDSVRCRCPRGRVYSVRNRYKHCCFLETDEFLHFFFKL